MRPFAITRDKLHRSSTSGLAGAAPFMPPYLERQLFGGARNPLDYRRPRNTTSSDRQHVPGEILEP